MELLLWLEQVYIWRLRREHGSPKSTTVVDLGKDEELPQATYPTNVNADNHRQRRRTAQ